MGWIVSFVIGAIAVYIGYSVINASDGRPQPRTSGSSESGNSGGSNAGGSNSSNSSGDLSGNESDGGSDSSSGNTMGRVTGQSGGDSSRSGSPMSWNPPVNDTSGGASKPGAWGPPSGGASWGDNGTLPGSLTVGGNDTGTGAWGGTSGGVSWDGAGNVSIPRNATNIQRWQINPEGLPAPPTNDDGGGIVGPRSGFATEAGRQRHFDDHGRELGYSTPEAYEQGARDFMSGPLQPGQYGGWTSTGDYMRADGSRLGIVDRNGTIRTFYRYISNLSPQAFLQGMLSRVVVRFPGGFGD